MENELPEPATDTAKEPAMGPVTKSATKPTKEMKYTNQDTYLFDGLDFSNQEMRTILARKLFIMWDGSRIQDSTKTKLLNCLKSHLLHCKPSDLEMEADV